MNLSITDKRLLYLLRLAIAGKWEDCALFSGMLDADWNSVLELSQKQGVCAVAFDGIELLPAEYRPSMDILMDWLGQASYIESQYDHHLELAKELTAKWAAEGIRTMVFKGLAHSRYYPKPNHREFGDFDCYQFGVFHKGNDLARQYGCTVEDDWYKHSEFSYKDLHVENHQFFTAARSTKHAKALNDYMVRTLGDGSYLYSIEGTSILLPPLELEGLFMLHHSLTHFLIEGISIRHFCDWACWIKTNQNKIIWSSFYGRCREFKLDGFVDVLNTIAVRYLGVDLRDSSIVTDSPYAEKVMKSAIYDDSAIYSRSKGRWYERFNFIKNAFKYSWKYRKVARYSMFGYLWSYVKGYLFREED